MIYKQKGINPKYPEEVEIWRIGMKVPEWLSDLAKVKFIDGDGNITLEKRDLSDGGYEIISASGEILIRTKTRGSIICRSGTRLFSLTEKQFNILYG